MILIPQRYIIKEGPTSVVRQYKNMRNMTGLNFASAGVMYAASASQFYHFNPVQGLACLAMGNINIWQGIRSFMSMKTFKQGYKQVLARASQINDAKDVAQSLGKQTIFRVKNIPSKFPKIRLLGIKSYNGKQVS